MIFILIMGTMDLLSCKTYHSVEPAVVNRVCLLQALPFIGYLSYGAVWRHMDGCLMEFVSHTSCKAHVKRVCYSKCLFSHRCMQCHHNAAVCELTVSYLNIVNQFL